ncbi:MULTISPECIES: hypothetical protein [Enterococcus]|uniref:hypothetical protein n=1 Tax=Enterococcus TaxID=1350 RepID=UPI001C8CEF83|nr:MULTISPECIES: hypothetical protein [Enterococcus]MBX9120937.1 hypothetical protein [Enterococcus sp. K18_3]MBX9127411.1 hypothetical protein [Enterococcus casseliflavus]
MYADKDKIEWLLFESGKSLYEIKKKSGVAATTVADLAHKRSSIERMRFDNAAKLTKLADQLKEETTE